MLQPRVGGFILPGTAS